MLPIVEVGVTEKQVARELTQREKEEAKKAAISAGVGLRSSEQREVDAVRESWLIEDRWWTEKPLRRRYWEVVTTCGRDEVVFHDLISGRWWRQR